VSGEVTGPCDCSLFEKAERVGAGAPILGCAFRIVFWSSSLAAYRTTGRVISTG